MAHSQILSESTFFPIEPTPTHTNLSIHPDTLIDDKKGEGSGKGGASHWGRGDRGEQEEGIGELGSVRLTCRILSEVFVLQHWFAFGGSKRVP